MMRTIASGAPFSIARITSTKAPCTVISIAPAAACRTTAALEGAAILSTVMSSAAKKPFSMAISNGQLIAVDGPVNPTTTFSAASVADPDSSAPAKIRSLASLLYHVRIVCAPQPINGLSSAWSLFDHLVGGRDDIGRDRQAEAARRAQIDDEVESGRLVEREIAGLGAAQNLIDVNRRATKIVGNVRAVGDEAAVVGKF